MVRIFIDSKQSNPWFKSFQSIRNYMYIMRSNDNLFEEKLYEAMTTYTSGDFVPERKLRIRYAFEKIELLKDKVLNRLPYDFTYK